MLRVLVLAALLVVCAVAYRDAPEVNSRPVIGILTQPTGSSISKYGSAYIAASYVKFFEGAGARVVPIQHTSSKEELKSIFSQINGVFFPGGGSDINNSQLYKAALYLFNLAVAANDKGDYFPVMGHCMGFEILATITSKNFSILEPFDAENIALPLIFDQSAYTSRYFARAGADLLHIYQAQNVTMNNHMWGVSPPEYKANPSFGAFWKILTTNKDRKGRTFVSTVEAVDYPIYGLQWHAEKALYEWDPKEVIPHSDAATVANQYIAEFYVSEARKSTHTFRTATEEYKALIYNYSPVYTAKEISFVQCYIW